MNEITMKLNADRYIRSALEEDITSEDITTNAVMPDHVPGTADLLCKQDGIICGLQVFSRVFELLDELDTLCMAISHTSSVLYNTSACTL